MPPLVIVAVNVTEVPAHIVVPGTAAIETVGNVAFTFTVTALLAEDVPQLLDAVTVLVLEVLTLLVVPVPPPDHAKVQPLHGLLTVSVVDCPWQIFTGPAGVTIGVTGN